MNITECLSKFKMIRSDKQIIKAYDMPDKLVLVVEPEEADLFLGVPVDNMYAVLKSTGAIENYTPSLEENFEDFFEYPEMTIED